MFLHVKLNFTKYHKQGPSKMHMHKVYFISGVVPYCNGLFVHYLLSVWRKDLVKDFPFWGT